MSLPATRCQLAQPDAVRNLRGGATLRRCRNGGKAASESEPGRNEKSSWHSRSPWDAATARPFITHAGCRDASQLRASVRRSGHCFSPPAPALLASSLFIYMRPRRPLCRWKSTLGCHAADPAYYCITAAAGRACDERRQIAGGTCWINLLSISSVTSPRHSP